ncbi:urea carboxylase [Ideonella sp. YS5]|uniref:urea carboxylase n=1 Tax=Ideonella sp. YS5 TaxID=3453714 RepID=UPI003EE90BE3
MFDTVLIANRGAIACRIIRTLRALGLKSVAVYSEADADSRHVALADEAVCIGPAPAAQSYLDAERILAAARATGAGAIHPGYGFLSENPAFADACEAAGIAFIGPTGAQMRAFGLKHSARELAMQHAVPLLPGSGLLADASEAAYEAERIGYPVMLKSTAGGGGIGMRLVRNATELAAAWEAVERLARANFKDAGLFLEKFVEQARHIEVQLFGDGRGRVVALGERDCSAQRRNQKVVEETPAPHLAPATREALLSAAVRLGQAVSYRSAGTVEYVLDAASGAFYFLEVNTRLQVEHGVTEQVTGVDLVAWMVKLARGEAFDMTAPTPRGASIQVRLYAEDPARNFQPSAGVLTEVTFPTDARVDGWVETGTDVPSHYDPMLAKLIVTADTREAAVAKLRDALAATRLAGIETNLRYLRAVATSPVFADGRVITRTLGELCWRPQALEVMEPGVQTTVQDWPGRVGYWAVGVPPSGPMDDLAMRLANRLVGNAASAAALECTLTGPSLRFHGDCTIAITGAAMACTLDGSPLALWTSHEVLAGSVLKLGPVQGGGARTYLAVRGGLDVPAYLGSRATFTLGQFGGHGGRTLRAGDMLHVGSEAVDAVQSLGADQVPPYTHHWDIGVLYGPHGAPDFFTPDDIGTFFGTDWQVHYNSSRTGVRLIGPTPQWARPDGGEAGLHPSNLHDNAYAIGAIDFTGDMPVILGPDGPSLGGFVCPAVVVAAERWKLGQLRPGDTIRFQCLTLAQATDLQAAQDALVGTLTSPLPVLPDGVHASEVASTMTPVLLSEEAGADLPAMVIRQAGDRYLLVEYGPMVLDLELRFRIHALMQAVQDLQLDGVVDLTPGIRSLQVHYDPQRLPREALLRQLLAAEHVLPRTDDLEVPTRTVWLPLSWDDAATRLAIEKYMQSVRPDAPWCPSNIEFIRRINGLASMDDVYRIVFDASYLVLGLGDVYLGAPVATPVDPRHRLVTTKYNPARTWTPENAVGIGGAYMCVYGMEGPGGYQFVGRTLQMWNRWRDATSGALEFEPGKPWLLRFFDQVRFFPVSPDELLQIRRDFPAGRYRLKIETGTFRLHDYRAMLAAHADDIARHKQRQQAAFDAERERWRAAGQAEYLSEDLSPAAAPQGDLPEGAQAVATQVTGSVWKLLVKEGEHVEEGAPLLVVESMKMEFSVSAPCSGTVLRLGCREGGQVAAGQDVVVLLRG